MAGAWATMTYLGRDGYQSVASDLMGMIARYKAGIAAIPGLHIIGRPHLAIIAVGSNEVDMFRVAELMAAKSWVPGLVQRPKGLHRMMSMLHAPSLDGYLGDLRDAVAAVRAEGGVEVTIKATY